MSPVFWVTAIVLAISSVSVCVLFLYFSSRTIPEGMNIRDALDAESKKSEKLKYEDFMNISVDQIEGDIEYNSIKFRKKIVVNTLDPDALTVRITLYGVFNKNLEESYMLTRSKPRKEAAPV